MKSNGRQTETCGGALRYSISTVLIVLLLGLMPAACSKTDGEGGHSEEQQTEGRPPAP